jgi:hypothetical protein
VNDILAEYLKREKKSTGALYRNGSHKEHKGTKNTKREIGFFFRILYVGFTIRCGIIIGTYGSTKMYINYRQRLKELYAYGESIASKNNFTGEDVFNKILK